MARLSLSGLASLSLLVATVPAGAQSKLITGARDVHAAAACIARIPPESLTRVPVYLEANLVDSTDRPILPSADLLVQETAVRIHRLLGATQDVLPHGDSVVTWPDLAMRARVTLHRDGHVTWRPRSDSTEAPPSLSGAPAVAAADLVKRALASLAADGERFLWPEELPGDSAVIELHLHHPTVRPDRSTDSLRLRVALPVFSLPVPPITAVTLRRSPRGTYPTAALDARVGGTVTLNFMVDTTGRVDPTTVREVWPPGQPRLTGQLGYFYHEFVRASTLGLAAARFEPARVGGCRVRQLVQQPFVWKIGPP